MPLDDHDRSPESDSHLPTVGEWGAEEPAPGAGPVESATVSMFCARCGETSVPVENCCPWCSAWLVGEPPKVAVVYEEEDDEPEDDWHTRRRPADYARPVEPRSAINPVVVVAVSYVILLASLIVFAVIAGVFGATQMEDLYDGMAVVQILDGVLAVVSLVMVWKTAKQSVPRGTRLVAWAVAVPVLAALLCLNIAYITFLRELLKPLGLPEQRFQLSLGAVFVICVLPGIVEELFFRQMVLGVFRKTMNLHAAVWVTAAMFAFIHVGQVLGIPYLLLAGAVFGYARVYGGLPLAMIMHFIHNLVVITYDSMR